MNTRPGDIVSMLWNGDTYLVEVVGYAGEMGVRVRVIKSLAVRPHSRKSGKLHSGDDVTTTAGQISPRPEETARD